MRNTPFVTRALHCAAAAMLALALAGCATRGGEAPDLVPLAAVAPGVQQDMRYHGANNFMGRPVAGYAALMVISTVWSPSAENAFNEFNRTVAYVAGNGSGTTYTQGGLVINAVGLNLLSVLVGRKATVPLRLATHNAALAALNA